MANLKKLFMILIILTNLFGCTYVLMPTKSPYYEKVIKESKGLSMNKILLVDISGELTSETSSGLLSSSENSVDNLKEILTKAEDDENIKAVVLRIDSPGGEVTASDLMYQEILKFKKRTKKKVYSLFMGVTASGGYYIAMASDRIYAVPTNITGSIGVISTIPNFKKLTDKIGVDIRVIKSGDKKDLGSIWREFSDDERKMLQDIIDEMYNQFFEVVKNNRIKIPPDKLKKLADGRVFTSKSALTEGLIDEIAYPDEVFESVKKLSFLSDYRLVTYMRRSDYKTNYYSQTNIPKQNQNTEINILKLENLFPIINYSPKFYYLWVPNY